MHRFLSSPIKTVCCFGFTTFPIVGVLSWGPGFDKWSEIIGAGVLLGAGLVSGILLFIDMVWRNPGNKKEE